MDEASLCDRIALILDGRFIGIDTPQHIADNFGEPLWAVGSDNMSKLLRDLRANPHVTSAFTFGPATMSPPMGNRPNRNCAIIFPDWATTMSKSRRSGPESRIVT